MIYTPRVLAEGDQFYADIAASVDQLVAAAHDARTSSAADRVIRLDEMAKFTMEGLPQTGEVAQLVYWFVVAIDRLAGQR